MYKEMPPEVSQFETTFVKILFENLDNRIIVEEDIGAKHGPINY